MEIKILDSWLREYLKTNASPMELAKAMSQSGPSFEKVEEKTIMGKKDFIYSIEVTTNRVDLMSVLGIAREACVILPEYGFKAWLTQADFEIPKEKIKKPLILKIESDPRLEKRIMGVVFEIPKVEGSLDFIKERLEATGIRALNAVVDITNYVMTEIGHPTHVFDFDLVRPYMKIRQSKKGESVQSFDGKTYVLGGGDIVIENAKGEIIDLPGIIGTKNSVVGSQTKRILFFIDNGDPVRIRKTSMKLGIRTVAATLNEKGVDPTLAQQALGRGIFLYRKYLKATAISNVFDIFSNKPRPESLELEHSFLEKSLGVAIAPTRVVKILTKLGMSAAFKGQKYIITPPSFRINDIKIPEDITEEVARIYGYHNIPSILMEGKIPTVKVENVDFEFETKIKHTLKNFSAVEVYTSPLVSAKEVDSASLALKNPLGEEGAYLRTSLLFSLISAAQNNTFLKEPIFLFEMANVYLPRKSNLPDEIVKLAGIFSGYSYRESKGIIEELFKILNVPQKIKIIEKEHFLPNRHISFFVDNKDIGSFGVLENTEFIYFEFDVYSLRGASKKFSLFKNIPKFPPQVEDITITLPPKTYLSDVALEIKKSDPIITDVKLKDVYNSSFTFRVTYQHPKKTLTNSVVEKIRLNFLSNLKRRFGATQK